MTAGQFGRGQAKNALIERKRVAAPFCLQGGDHVLGVGYSKIAFAVTWWFAWCFMALVGWCGPDWTRVPARSQGAGLLATAARSDRALFAEVLVVALQKCFTGPDLVCSVPGWCWMICSAKSQG